MYNKTDIKQTDKNICQLLCDLDKNLQSDLTARFFSSPDEKWWNGHLISLDDVNKINPLNGFCEVHAFYQLNKNNKIVLHIIADKNKSDVEQVNLQARLIDVDGIRTLRDYFSFEDDYREGFSLVNEYVISELSNFKNGINIPYNVLELNKKIRENLTTRK